MQLAPQEEIKMMTPDEEAKLIRSMAKARTSLVLEHAFIGNIALNLPVKLDYTIKTAATNGHEIRYNPWFMADKTDEERKFVIAHECFHPMLEHPTRIRGRNHRKFNQAGDYVINQLLSDENIGKMPQGGLLNKAIYDAGGGTTDGIYNILPDNDEGNDPMDDCEDSGGTPADQAQQQAEWKVRVAQAAQAAKMMGQLSANMARLVESVLAPKVDWRDVLRRFISKARNDERSFARFNRRFVSQGLYLPSVSGEAMGEILFAVDCSGSIDQDTINQFAAEVQSSKDECNPLAIHVVYFDSEVSHYDKFTRDEDVVISPHGGGGTAFSPIFKYITDNNIEPVACIVLTDLCCNDFGDEPDYPVLWVSNHSDQAPWGEVVMM
jgi:predicted metal-dependent peptidase